MPFTVSLLFQCNLNFDLISAIFLLKHKVAATKTQSCSCRIAIVSNVVLKLSHFSSCILLSFQVYETGSFVDYFLI